jgi:hypothetical protein
MTGFADTIVHLERPESVRRDVALPRHLRAFPSPVDWSTAKPSRPLLARVGGLNAERHRR